MNPTASRYLDLAFEYHVAAMTLNTHVFETPYLYNPIAYLLRHTIELLLKGLVINEEKRLHRISIKKMKVGNKNISSQHSLLFLWSYLNDLTPLNLEKADIILIDSVVGRLDKKDFSSTRYRYPYKGNKSGPIRQIPLEPIEISVSDIGPDLSEGIPQIAIHANQVGVLGKGSKLLCEIKDIFDVAELLFKLTEQHDM